MVLFGEPGATGHMARTGNQVREGDEFPAVVIRAWPTEANPRNLQVLLDGSDTYWATSRPPGDEPGQWRWPDPPERELGDRPARF